MGSSFLSIKKSKPGLAVDLVAAEPRFSSGVNNCTRVCRTTTLILSIAPQRKSIRDESQNQRENPNPMVANPNPATAQSSVGPAFWRGGRCARTSAHSNEPAGSAA